MKKAVVFRDFEERDIDFIYKCKNDEDLNSMIVGEWHPYSYEEAVKWVHGCMGEHDNYKFWAVCTNDESKEIIGWTSISNIDLNNKSVCFHSIVIANAKYRGIAWIEVFLFVYDYIFRVLNMNRLYASHIKGHPQSSIISKIMFETFGEVSQRACFKNGKYYDINNTSLLKDEYEMHLMAGDYEIRKIMRRIANENKNR